MEYVWIILAIVVVLWFVLTYNKFVKLIESVTNSEKEISVQLDGRGKIFDSMIAAVKRYMEHEEGVLTKVTELRSQAKQGDPLKNGEAHKAEDELSKIIASGELTASLNLTMEAYPELKSNENMLHFQEEIATVERRLMFAKKAYNNAIETYNVKRKSLPDLVVPSLVSSLSKEFSYWELTEEAVKEAESRRVEF